MNLMRYFRNRAFLQNQIVVGRSVLTAPRRAEDSPPYRRMNRNYVH
jgi:hypothetical protein